MSQPGPGRARGKWGDALPPPASAVMLDEFLDYFIYRVPSTRVPRLSIKFYFPNKKIEGHLHLLFQREAKIKIYMQPNS